mgnify:CR=1 FL=1
MKRSKAFIIGLAVFFVLVQIKLWFGDGSLEDRARLMRDIEQQQTANDRLEARNEVVELEIEEFREDPDAAIEERAREELGLIKEGETLYILVEDE